MKLIQICALSAVMAAAAVAQNATQDHPPAAVPSPTPKSAQKAGAPVHAKPAAHKAAAVTAKKKSATAPAKAGPAKAPVKTPPAKSSATASARKTPPPVKVGVVPEKKTNGANKMAAPKATTAKPVKPVQKPADAVKVLPVKPKAPAKPAVTASVPARKTTRKPATKMAGSGPKPTLTAAGPSVAEKKPAPRLIGSAGRRDPFVSPIRSAGSVSPTQSCTSGKRCLAIPELILQGTVRDITGKMMAVVSTSNRRTYTLRENDQVFNGSVEKITSDSIIFREYVKDALGRESAKEVVKKMGPSS